MSKANSAALLDAGGNQLLPNTRAELVWVKATDAPHVVPGDSDVRLSEALKNVVYLSNTQTITGAKTFSATTTTSHLLPIGANVEIGSDSKKYKSIYGKDFYGETGTFSGNVSVDGTLGVSGKTTLSDELEVTKATTLKSTLDVTGLITAKNGILLDDGKSLLGKFGNSNYRLIGYDPSGIIKVGVNAVDNTEVMAKTKLALGLSPQNTITDRIEFTSGNIKSYVGGKEITVTNEKGIYSNGGVAAMGILEAGSGGGGVGKLADCSDVDKIEDGGENYVKRTEVSGTNNWKAQQGDVLYAYGEGVFKAKPLFDNNGKVLVSTLPDSLLGQVLYGGNFNASGVCTLTNSFKAKYGVTSLTITSTNASAYEGVFFIASASGTVAGKAVETGDWLISDGSAWQKVDNNDAVTGVKGDSETVYRTGQINITKANIGLGNVENTALSSWAGSGNITTLGTITSGIWHGSKIAKDYLADGVQTSLGKADSAVQDANYKHITVTSTSVSDGTNTFNKYVLTNTDVNALTGLTISTSGNAATATTATNLASAPSLSFTSATSSSAGSTLTVSAGGKTSTAITIDKVRSAFAADSATKATQDASGNVITTTYATKVEVSSLTAILSGGVAGLDARLNDIEDWKNNPVADSFEVGMLNVTRGINLNGQDVYSADSIATLFSDGVITNRHIANGSIANNKLANSSIKIGTTSVSLGGTAASLEGLTSISAGTLNGTLGKKIQFGHLNGSGAFEVDSTFNNSANLNVRIVKYGYTLPESDVNGHHRHAALVTDANGNGYIVTQLGFQVLNETYEPVPVA